MTYSFVAKPVGRLAKTATRACLRGAVETCSARDARKLVEFKVMHLFPPRGEWCIRLTREDGLRLKPHRVQVAGRVT